ncbi:MAG: MCE family protein [Deltaproteobacteria bacterium]|nr:MCE family protein [Deltaproteobacteria bacterium]
MASQRTKFTLGLFITCGIGIAFFAIIWLGMSRFFEKGQYYATYFNESVQGLDVESPVTYRGVSIGRVNRISVAPDAHLIQVILKIESGQTLDNNIVAQLKAVGITGSMFIELDHKKNGEPDLSPSFSFPSKFPIIASKPSNINKLIQSIDDALNQIGGMDLKGISGKIQLVLDNLNQTIDDANVKGVSKNIATSFEKVGQSLNKLMDKASSSLDRMENTIGLLEGITIEKQKTIKNAIEDFRKAMENANVLSKQGVSLVSGTHDSLFRLSQHLLSIAQNLENASENLNRFIELVSEHPSQLIFGTAPIPRKVEQDNN